jgi:hypothetical protein
MKDQDRDEKQMEMLRIMLNASLQEISLVPIMCSPLAATM